MVERIDASPEYMESERIGRYSELKSSAKAFIDALIPGYERDLYNIIGRGVVEDPRMSPPIAEDHGFTVAFITCEANTGAALHSHETAEVFMPLNGSLVVYWGDDGEEELTLEPWDTISVPEGVMRGFRNPNDEEVVILAMVGQQDGGGPVKWHPEVLARAKHTGLGVEDGKLVRLENFAMPEGMEEIETG